MNRFRNQITEHKSDDSSDAPSDEDFPEGIQDEVSSDSEVLNIWSFETQIGDLIDEILVIHTRIREARVAEEKRNELAHVQVSLSQVNADDELVAQVNQLRADRQEIVQDIASLVIQLTNLQREVIAMQATLEMRQAMMDAMIQMEA